MEFSDAITRIVSVLRSIGSDISSGEYDGLIVKKLMSSNTLGERSSTKQTHIAITGPQMDMFPCIRADGYFDCEYDSKDDDLKKYLTAQIPVFLHKENVTYLDQEADLFPESEHLVHVSIVRARRENSADQIQFSMTSMDSQAFVKYRKLIPPETYMIILKRKEKLFYDLYCVKQSDGEIVLSELNNEFYKLPKNTLVKLDEVVVENKDDSSRILLPFEKSKECARQIVDCIYAIDSFNRIKDLTINNDKNVKIKTDSMGGNYLRYMFAKSASTLYAPPADERTRVFTEKDYSVPVNDVIESCRLSTEWKSSELSIKNDGNYLRALIAIVNERYSGFLRIYEDAGNWYLEYLTQTFTLEKLPYAFQNSFARRYITSLLAKPFVILTGNSGTGKTRMSRQFADYLEVYSEDGKKNWVLIPVGADWTDNTKILGFYNPLADEGRGRYEKTEILHLIEQANEHKSVPYFIILDEMNLSHVERYFADFLSHMETMNIPFVLDGYNGCVEYPSNIFVIGTVNIDETTYMFSPKVLDRANVLEFKPDEEAVLDLFVNPSTTNSVSPANTGTAEAFLKLATVIRSDVCNLDGRVLQDIQNLFRQVYEITKKYGYEFAYRTVREIRQYIAASYELLEDKSSFDLAAIEDEQLVQKILPKIHGNKKEIGQLLDELETLCENNNLKLSGEKIKQMRGKLATVQYASFI